MTEAFDARGATDRLAVLEGAIDLHAIPFTEPGGRLLVFLDPDGALRVSSAEYEQPSEATGPLRALRFLDETGSPLPVEARARPDRVALRIGGSPAWLAFLDPSTLMLALPEGRSRLLLEPRVDEDGSAAAFAWRAGGSVVRREDESGPDGHPCVRLDVDAGSGDAILLSAGPTDRLPVAPPGAEVLEAAAARWRHRLARVPLPDGRSSDAALRAAWVLAANQLRLRSDPSVVAVVPSKMGYVGAWQWDAYFHAIGLRHLDLALAKDQLRLALASQLPDGMLPDVVHDEGVLASSADMVAADRERSLLHVGRKEKGRPWRLLVAPLTKPPLTALAAWKVFETEADVSFLEEVYPAIARSQCWWFERSRPGGRALPIYLHPYSSGVDDSPLWDPGWPVATPDLPAYLALQADHLARIADVLDRPAEATRWRNEAEVTMARLVARHWRSRRGSFVSFARGRPVAADAVLGLVPIITGRLPAPLARAVLASITDPRRYWPAHPVPSVALDDPAFDAGTMWRGPTWLFMDWLLVDGLRRAGFDAEAEALRERALRMVEGCEGMAEYYDPLDGRRPSRASAMFSGTAALYLDLLLSGA